MLNFKAIVRSIMAKRRCDEDSAWSAVAQAYLNLDTTRPIPQQASYLMKAGCFFTCERRIVEEVAIEGLEEVLPAKRDFDEESFMKALSPDAQEVAADILNQHIRLATVDSIRWSLKKQNLNYSRKRAKEVLNELQRNRLRQLRVSGKDAQA
jgi:hypothetical protein